MAEGTISDKVAIVGMGLTRFGELWTKSDADVIVEAAWEAYEDAGIGPNEVDAAFVGTIFTGVTAACLAEPLKMDMKPVTRVENNCGSGSEALRVAALSIAAGMYDTVLALGFEKCKDCGFNVLPTTQPDSLEPVYNTRLTGPGAYAMAAIKYWHKYGIDPLEGKRTLAKIAVKNHHNGSMHPKAHLQREVSMEAVMMSPPIVYPLGLFDCCPTTDGAAAAILTRADLAKKFRDDYVLIKGMGVAVSYINPWNGKCKSDVDLTFWTETDVACQQVKNQTGVKDFSKEVQMVELHDCFTITELIAYESLGICKKGEGTEAVDDGRFLLDGKLPVNPDGGLKSFGHPIGASGIRMVYEGYKQIQGKAEKPARQLKNVDMALIQCQGGVPGTFQANVQLIGAADTKTKKK